MQTRKNQGLFGKGLNTEINKQNYCYTSIYYPVHFSRLQLTLHHTIPWCNNLENKASWKHRRKKEKMLVTSIFSWLQSFPFPKIVSVLFRDKSFYFSHCNPFPKKPLLLPVCSSSLMRTMWEKEKLLKWAISLFYPCYFLPLWELSSIFIKFEIVVCKFSLFGRD